MTAFFTAAHGEHARVVKGADMSPGVRGPAHGAWMSLTIDPRQIRSTEQLSAALDSLRTLLVDWQLVRRDLNSFPAPLTSHAPKVAAEVRIQQTAARVVRDNA